MVSDPMSSTQAVRREDLFRDAAARDENGTPIKSGGGSSDEAAAAAQAELDAYMKSMLGLHFAIPEPQHKEKTKKVSIPAPTKKEATKPSTKTDDSDVDMDSSDDDQPEPAPIEPTATEFVFRMFSTSGKAAATMASEEAQEGAKAQPVVLLDDNADGTLLGPGAIMEPRPPSYYIARELSDDARACYAHSAVSGDRIIAQASAAVRNAWGLEVPWRVRTLKADRAALRALLANSLAPGQRAPADLPAALAAAVNSLPAWAGGAPPPGLPDTHAGSRKRPGKKQRILLRRRDKARREQEAAEAAKAQAKEEQLSEKKKRLNRIKKLRRREKAKASKTGDAEAGGADSGNDSGGD